MLSVDDQAGHTRRLWEALADDLLAYFERRGAQRAKAEDLLHEVFVRVQDKIGGLLDEDAVVSWVYRIARNVLVDDLRRARDVSADVEPIADEPDPDAEVDLAREALGHWLRVAVEELPEPYREALRLVEVEGLTQREAALRLGVSYSTLKSRVQRGRARLRQALHQCCALEFDVRGRVVDFKARDDCDSSCC